MQTLIDRLLTGPLPSHLHPFTKLNPDMSRDDIEQIMLELKAGGIQSMNFEWGGGWKAGMQLTSFNSEAYWERIAWVVALCRKHQMTFMMQDAAPFPTGAADGWFARPEYADRNKVYLNERHIDICGPNPHGAFHMDNLIGAMRMADLGNGMPKPGDKILAVVALRRDGEAFDADSAVDLTGLLRDGMISWPVPAGIWRIYCLYVSPNGGGRPDYMNLLDPRSVALNIEAVHQPHFEHLKDEIGKTWLGFFYDETEVGNVGGGAMYDFFARIGDPKALDRAQEALPWSPDMEAQCEAAWGAGFRTLLPLLWCRDVGGRYHSVRCRFMDIISRLIRDNYNGQMHRWCQERGIQYIGHVLEDENSHARLGCGPTHFFRMEKHQDMGGVDLIGNQVMPYKDFPQAWYGNIDGDGEFYHYGLAKLASSEAHISPNKHGRSFCEVFAVYGPLAGTRLRKFLLDYLFVNGINMLIPADPRVPNVDIRFSLRESSYANRMCELLQSTTQIIRTAVLYHAEAEWYQADYQLFQKPAAQLARHQISYDIIPADVFEDTAFYHTDWSDGLIINGNRYDALIIPGADALPQAVAAFLPQAEKSGFPVIFCDWKPSVIAETGAPLPAPYGRCVPLAQLPAALEPVLRRDIRIEESAPWLRYLHATDGENQYYLLHNEGGACQIHVQVPCPGPACRIDLDHQTREAVGLEAQPQGSRFALTLAEFEMVLLCFGPAAAGAPVPPDWASVPVAGPWHVTMATGEQLELPSLEDIYQGGRFARETGPITYETEVLWDQAPDVLDLGDVYEIASVYINGALAGEAQYAPYRVPVKGLAVPGMNTLRIVVQPNTARSETRNPMLGNLSAGTYNSMDPGGILGPVTALVHP